MPTPTPSPDVIVIVTTSAAHDPVWLTVCVVAFCAVMGALAASYWLDGRR